MCGRYGFSVEDAQKVYDRFEIETVHFDLKPRYNIAPGQVNPTIISHSPNELTGMFWGLIPSWARDDSFKFKTINARSEDVENKPMYKKPFRFQRCMVPATGFYEWYGDKPPKQPYYFKMKDDSMFAFAGLYDIWHDPKTGKEVKSYTILTCAPNSLVGKYHNRMPVILDQEDEEKWVNPDISEIDDIKEMIRAYPASKMEAYPVSTSVNYAKTDTKDLIKPINSK